MNEFHLGIDIGSVAISMAVLDGDSNIKSTRYEFHKGQIGTWLTTFLDDISFSSIRSITCTSSSPGILKNVSIVDSQVAYIQAAMHMNPAIEALLIIGAEKFGLATFNKAGQYLNYRSNSSCAAGTGNFLDQQSERLNLQSIHEFCEVALKNKGNFPKIASRCAVFAKTDLIHAQQEGYSLSEICDGLSYGLAKNIIDTVFHTSDQFSEVIVAGGVALNQPVLQHISALTNKEITADKYANVYGAIGAALTGISENFNRKDIIVTSINDIVSKQNQEKKYSYNPLYLSLSDYPDFTQHKSYRFTSVNFKQMEAVEVDIYTEKLKSNDIDAYLGIDIGSTSTKAILLDNTKQVLAGFYTRTAGQPLQAVQLIFESISDLQLNTKSKINICGAGTTGSGRKFTGQIVGSDIILDEITAHARAAYELDPDTDTIIEIGGQDSKFTLMKNGVVTFSVMNNVCAAGTGSFIEEQAKRLGCPLGDFAARAEKVSSPMASDRCTVFMERDLNHYLMSGYSTNEILAAVLHSTRENYLTKVASKGAIGNKIFFQGATAKNKALVAAFEQKLNKPIMVSRYCHLTGALGVALELYDSKISSSTFRGLDLWQKSIPLRSEVCELCTNHCKLKVAEVEGHTEAYGFLCGRDYQTNKYITTSTNSFQLIKKHNEIFRTNSTHHKEKTIIGIPAGLNLFEELHIWKKFFDELQLNTITSDKNIDAILTGKNISNAEFCAPISALHGHISYLMDKADYVFLPVYLKDSKGASHNQQYCYYTQYMASIAKTHPDIGKGTRILSPLLKFSQNNSKTKLALHHMLKSAGLKDISLSKVSRAWQRSQAHNANCQNHWKKLYQKEIQNSSDIHIVLLGRPYSVLSPVMNSNIPDLIEKQNVKAFYMDMLPEYDTNNKNESEKAKKWKYGAKILNTATIIANTENCYPVLVTSFKCTPDSFISEYYKEIFEKAGKPYLILQLDEHDSSVGYETRIEAGIRAFRNHQQVKNSTPDSEEIQRNEISTMRKNLKDNQLTRLIGETEKLINPAQADLIIIKESAKNLHPEIENLSNEIITGRKNLVNKTLLLPCWDQYVGPLLEAVLQNSGIDARLLKSTEASIQESQSMNTGQCLPLNIIVQNAANYIKKHNLNPSNTAIWIMRTRLSCNLPMFPYYFKRLLKLNHSTFQETSVYVGHLIFHDFSLKTAINAYLAYMFGGYIRKIACSIRPYEKTKGNTNKVLNEAFEILYKTFKNGHSKEESIKQIVENFENIEKEITHKPKVAIFGDLYIRDNDLFNQNLINTIENNGGEVITTPFSEYLKIIVGPHTERSLIERNWDDYLKIGFLKSLIRPVESRYLKYFRRFYDKFSYPDGKETTEWLEKFALMIQHRGESSENVLKIQMLLKQHPDIDLFVQTNPSYCCPSLVTQAMAAKIEEVTNIPVVTIEYDGTLSPKNEQIIPYLKFREKKKEPGYPIE